MRVLVAHVHYRQPGGEDAVFGAEVDLLREADVHVETLELFSAHLDRLPVWDQARIAGWYPDHDYGRRRVRDVVRRLQPDVVHFHHLYPLLGPGAVQQADAMGCATVQTLHNYRLSCLAGTHLREGRTCMLCRPGRYGPGVLYGCYRGSRVLSHLVRQATTQQWLQFLNDTCPALWITVTPFMRRHWIALGAPPERIIVKPSSVSPGDRTARSRAGVFCGGRLSPEKRIVELIEAWPPDAPLLTVAGDGPLHHAVASAARLRANVRFVGHLPHHEFLAAIAAARILVMPSIWPEPLPIVALEAFAEGTPVVVFEATSLASVVQEVDDECVVRASDFAALTRRAADLVGSPSWSLLHRRCHELWERRFSHPVNQRRLLHIYDLALAMRAGHRPARQVV